MMMMIYSKDYDPSGFKWTYKQSFISEHGIFGCASHVEEPLKMIGVYPWESWINSTKINNATKTNATGIFFREAIIYEPGYLNQTENEQVLQYKTTLIGIYNIRGNYSHGIFGFLPVFGFNALINITDKNTNIEWIFGDYQSIYVGLAIANNTIYSWNITNIAKTFKMYQIFWNTKQNAIIFEMIERDTFNKKYNDGKQSDIYDFIYFMFNLTKIDFSNALNINNPSVTYYSPITQSNYLMIHDGERKINDEKINYDSRWPLFKYIDNDNNVYLQQSQNSDILYFNMSGKECHYDFKQYQTDCT